MDARTWSYGGRDWPYDDETSAEIDARVARALDEEAKADEAHWLSRRAELDGKAQDADGGSPSDLERYENEVFAPTIETSGDPAGIAISDPEWAL